MRARVLAAAVLAIGALAASLLVGQPQGVQTAEVWMFDQTSAIGGHATKVLGHPQVITTPFGRAVQFDGVEDAIFVTATYDGKTLRNYVGDELQGEGAFNLLPSGQAIHPWGSEST
jgi:hypothetical protein